jgi:hypothetical protein
MNSLKCESGRDLRELDSRGPKSTSAPPGAARRGFVLRGLQLKVASRILYLFHRKIENRSVSPRRSAAPVTGGNSDACTAAQRFYRSSF